MYDTNIPIFYDAGMGGRSGAGQLHIVQRVIVPNDYTEKKSPQCKKTERNKATIQGYAHFYRDRNFTEKELSDLLTEFLRQINNN